MGLIAKSKGGGGDFDPVKLGLHIAICYAVFDIGTHKEEKWGNDVHKVIVCWELPTERIEIDGKNLPSAISKFYRLSLHKKATLRQDLESWRSRAFTEQEIESGFNLKKLLSIPCQVNVVHNYNADKDRTYANISSVVPAPIGTELQPENPLAFFSFEEWPEKGIPVGTPDWIQDKIKSSHEWTASLGQSKRNEPQEQGPPIDDDIPF